MSDQSRQERRSALDEFAKTGTKQETVALPAVISHQPPAHLIHGPQMLAKPRDIAHVFNQLRTLAAAAGDSWFYRIPFRDRKSGKTTYAEGPSVKMSNDLVRVYGAIDVDQWVSGEGSDFWEITTRIVDLESGAATTTPFRQRKSAARIGGGDDARNLEASFAIGCSKSRRNTVVNFLQSFADFAFEEARNALVDKYAQDVDGWRQKMVDRINQMVALPRVEAVIGRAAKDWTASDIAKVAAMGRTVAENMATLDETFPPLGGSEPVRADLDAFAKPKNVVDQSIGGTSGQPSAEGGGKVEPTPQPPPEDSAAAGIAFEKSIAIEAMLGLAHSDGDEDDRIAEINRQWPIYQKKFEKREPEFLGRLFAIAEQVARGELKLDEARRDLEGRLL